MISIKRRSSYTKYDKKSVITDINKIVSEKKSRKETHGFEHQIDVMVYHLYGLSYEEACVVDNGLRLEDYERYKLE